MAASGRTVEDQAWVTLATNDAYALGALVLSQSLQRVGTTRKLVVLVTPGVTPTIRELLSQDFDLVQEVNVLDSNDSANLALLTRPELGVTFTKLHCWRLTQYKKAVFLDADILVIQNCDELFDREELSAAPDVGWPDCFNSGVFVFVPSDETYQAIIQFAVTVGSFDGGDQGLLNLFFSDWATKDIARHLSFVYNMISSAAYSYLPAYQQFGKDVKVVHFLGALKPWNGRFNPSTGLVEVTPGAQHALEHLQHWWNLFVQHVQPRLQPDSVGLPGQLAQLSIHGDQSVEQKLQERARQFQWEQGQIDYLGADAFANIQKKLDEATGAAAPEPAPVPDSTTTPAPEPAPAPASEPAPAPASESTPAPASESAPAPVSETTPAPASESAPAPVSEPAPAPVSEPAPAPVSEPAPAPVSESAPAPVSEPAPAPVSEPAPSPAAEQSLPPAPAAEPAAATAPETAASQTLTVAVPTEVFTPELIVEAAVKSVPIPLPAPQSPTSSPEAGLPSVAAMPAVDVQSVPAPVVEAPSVPVPVEEAASVPAAVAEAPSVPAPIAEVPSVPASVVETSAPVAEVISAACEAAVLPPIEAPLPVLAEAAAPTPVAAAEAAPVAVEVAPVAVEVAPVAVEVAPAAAEAAPVAATAAPVAAEATSAPPTKPAKEAAASRDTSCLLQ